MSDRLPGKVVLLFQPAEEGVPRPSRPAGAELMVTEGVLDDPKVDAVFGLHVFAGSAERLIGCRAGPLLAAADRFEIVVEGHQTHGSKPWAAVDPIVSASEIVGALQTIVSREVDITKEPAVVTVGQFDAGVRNNIIPDRARLVGTIRTFDEGMRRRRPRAPATHRREDRGGPRRHAQVTIEDGYPVTANDPALTAQMLPDARARRARPVDGGREDHGRRGLLLLRAPRVPGLFVFLGVRRRRTRSPPRTRTTRRGSSSTRARSRRAPGCWRTSRPTGCWHTKNSAREAILG